MKMILATMVVLSTGALAATTLPAGFGSQLPPGYKVIARAHIDAGHPLRSFEIVALARKDEAGLRQRTQSAPARPLLVFEQKGKQFLWRGRNDHVVLKADEGGQCDPFLDTDAKIAVKGRFFTVENGVACGQHWTDYVTFRLDDHAQEFVFDNERQEAWELNPSSDPNAEALVRAQPPRVIRNHPGHATSFTVWRPQR